MGTPGAPSPASGTSKTNVLVIHHIADLGQSGDPGAGEPLAQYIGRINRLRELETEEAEKAATNPRVPAVGSTPPPPQERPPDVVIISGSILAESTSDGVPADPRTPALGIASAGLSAVFSQYGRALSDSVFVVPGTRDIDWTSRSVPFGPFLERYASFGVPAITSPASSSAPNTPGAKSAIGYRRIAPSSAAYEVHLLNTCLATDDLIKLPRRISLSVDRGRRRYRRLLRINRVRSWLGNRKQRATFRSKILSQAQSPADVLGTGRVPKDELTAFTREAGAPDGTSLKILVTHHLLQERRSQVMPGAAKTAAPQTNYAEVLAVARKAGFHLAFSTGEALNEVLADVPTRGSSRPPLRQIVTPSLQKTQSYNEIIATRDMASGQWRVEARTVKLSDPPAPAATVILLNTPAVSVPVPPVAPNTQAVTRQQLEQRVRTALRQLAEEIASGAQDVPTTPLATLRDAVEEVVFPAFTIGNIGLALKRTTSLSQVQLVSDFITDEDWSDARFLYPFEYPGSPAAWALILGKIITCSKQLSVENMLDDDDIEWLNNTGRRARVLDLLEQQVALATRLLVDPATKADKVQRATRLRDGFGQNRLNLQVTADYPAQSLTGNIEEVIYVPVPHRTTAGNVQDLPEMGTLVIEVGSLKDAYAKAQPILTSERWDMLTTISDAMYAILAAANELGRPRGSWRRLL